MLLFASDTTDLLSRIPLSARTILDVGCGTGHLAASYRQMNPKARVLGIEADPTAAAVAARHLTEVATTSLDVDPLPFDLPDGLDCIIYNETLAQLRDPWALIRRHADKLSRDGMMLICCPNAEYWRIAERMLHGRWRGTNAADVPNVPASRWLEIGRVQDNVEQAGLTLGDVTIREPDAEEAAHFAETLAPGLEAMGIDPHDYAERSAPSHTIWRFRREPCQRLIVAGNMLDPVGGVSHVRVVHPIEALTTDPAVTAQVTNRVEVAQPGDTDPRIFVLHRPALVGDQGRNLLRHLIEGGYLVVTEFDDLPDHFDMMRMGGALGFYGVHAVQTSTISMAEALRAWHTEIAVFPNAIGKLPEVRNFAQPNSLTLFFGALNRERDWRPFMPALNDAASMAGDRLKFQVVHDRSFFDALETPYKRFTPICDYETYLRLLGDSEISFMPLSDTRFNRAKSDLKFIEAGACRVAALASSVVYGDSVTDGRTGLLFRDPVEFHARLMRLLAMPELARDIADAARRYVIDERMLAYQVAPRIAWYRSLWARRTLLDEARRQRMMRFHAAS